MRRVLVTVAVLLAALAPSAPASAGTTPDGEPSTPRACTDALALIDSARPGDALTLIEAYRSTSGSGTGATGPESGLACDDVYAAASAAISTAQDLAQDARVLVPGDEPPASGARESWAAAVARAEQALVIDEQNVDAAEVLADSPQAPAQRMQRTWRTFVETVEPLGTPLLALGITILVLAVLARAVVPATLHWPVLTPRQRCVATVAGWSALASGAVLLVWGPAGMRAGWSGADLRVSDAVVGVVLALAVATAVVTVALALPRLVTRRSRSDRARWWSWTACAIALAVLLLVAMRGASRDVSGALPGLAVAALGVLLTGTVLATRLRLTVDVTSGSGSRSSEDGSGGAHLVALLGELGAEPPRGLETPSATDTRALGGSALAELPQQAFAKAVLTAVQWLLGSVPWRVTVEETNPDHLAVIVTRNGRAAGSAVVDRARILGTSTTEPTTAAAAAKIDLHRAAAAVVLLTLSRHHPGFDGLCGATEWRGLALYYVAQTDFATTPEHKKSLLARAVSFDPANDLAQVAFQYARTRQDTIREDLDDYRAWLSAFLDRTKGLDGYRSLRLRALYSRAVVATNACFASYRDGSPAAAEIDDDARSAVLDLLDLLGDERAAGREDALVQGLRDAAESMCHQAADGAPERAEVSASCTSKTTVQSAELRDAYFRAMGVAPPPLAEVGRRTTTPRGDYNLACTYAIRQPLQDVDVQLATDHLRRAVELPGMLDWLHKDPMLTAYRGRQEYLDEFGTDPAGPLDVEPFARHVDALRAVGLTTTGRILARRPPALTADLATTPEVAADLRAAAQLVEDLPDARGRYDVADVLLSRGVKTVSPTSPELPAKVVTAVRDRIARTRLDPTDRERWATWLGRA